MQIEKRKLTELTLDPNNARTHSDTNLKAIQASLEKFGQRKPIVITDDGMILAGNGTATAAEALGWETIEVAIVPKEWDAETAKAYALADNRSAELAAWDTSILASQLIELDVAGWDIGELGFDKPEPPTEDREETEDVPEPPAEPTTKPGDIWKLGNHRLICGDSTAFETYDKLMNGEVADLVWTDPPYGVSYVGGTKDALTIQNDDLDHAALEQFLRDAFTAIIAYTKPGACWYVASPSGNLFQSFSIPLSELEVWKHTLVWVKSSLVLGRADYHYRHESIFYGWTPGGAHQPPPDRKQDTVWEFPKPSRNGEHPTMKPVELIVRAIKNSTKPDQLVLDSFAGSGSTLIACEQTGRKARVIELDPKYCDVIVKRWENLTGNKAELITQ